MTTMQRLSGTWTIDDAALILCASGHRTNPYRLHRVFREQGWIQGKYATRITETGWTYLDYDGDRLVITGPGIAETHRVLGGDGDVRVTVQVIR